MTPTFSKLSTNDHINDIQLSQITSSNIRAARIARSNARFQDDNPSKRHRPRTVYVSKEQYSISLVPLEDISTPAWKKQRGFDQLETSVNSLTRTHQIADLIELVSTKNPIDVHSAAQDSMKQIHRILVSAYDISNLNVSAFLTATGKKIQLKSEKVSNRPEGVSVFKFSYNLDPSSIDPQIVQTPRFFSLCLCLPQHR